MTRGYVLIIDNIKSHNILSCAYQNSDSYFSGLGIEVLNAYEKKDMENFIKDKLKENEDYNDDIEGIEWSWIDKAANPNPEECFFNDYAYVYVNKTDELMVYHYGDFSFKFKRKDIDVIRFIFDNSGEVYNKMAFDIKKREYERETYAHVKRILRNKMTVEEIQKVIETPVNSLYMESGRILDYFGSNNFDKRVVDVDTDLNIMFHVKKSTFYGEKRDVYIKTILGNILIKENSSSAESAERFIKRIIKEEYDSIMNLYELLSFIEEYQKVLDSYIFITKNIEIVKESSKNELEKIIEKIKEYKSSTLIFKKNNSTLSENRFRSELEKRREKMLKSES